MTVRVKICGLTRNEDAREAERAGATYGGVILAAGGPRAVTSSDAEAIFRGTELRRVGVFVNETPARMYALAAELGLDVIQLHGDETPAEAEALRRATEARVWKALRPRSGEDFAASASAYADRVDGILLDGWSPEGRGGTGARFPWSAVAAHRTALAAGVELIVAGGLNPGNVAHAIAILAPDVVDVSSGVELRPRLKDPHSIHRFAAAARGAAAQQGIG